MSEEVLRAGDIRLDKKQIYLVISDKDGSSKFLRVWLSSGQRGLSLSALEPSEEDRLLCNIQGVFTTMKEKAAGKEYG